MNKETNCISAITWSPTSEKLYSGDENGNIVSIFLGEKVNH